MNCPKCNKPMYKNTYDYHCSCDIRIYHTCKKCNTELKTVVVNGYSFNNCPKCYTKFGPAKEFYSQK